MSQQTKERILEFAEWAVKGILAFSCVLLWNLNRDLQTALSVQVEQARQITEIKSENDSLRSEIRSVRAEMVSKDEFNATLKRVEQQLEIVLLKAELKMKGGRS
jgi:cell division protein FtsB